MRKPKWAEAELAACPFFTDSAREHIGRWQEFFVREQPLQLELGCGKGGFIAELAVQHPELNFMAVDITKTMLSKAKRSVEQSYALAERAVDNLVLVQYDIERIADFMDERDAVERVYINFCNPWPRRSQHKKRLTHTRQLLKYKQFLCDGAELRFKTDDDELFEATLGYLQEAGGFTVKFLTRDLHSVGCPENIVTEHERMFSAEGIPIKFLTAQYHSGQGAE